MLAIATPENRLLLALSFKSQVIAYSAMQMVNAVIRMASGSAWCARHCVGRLNEPIALTGRADSSDSGIREGWQFTLDVRAGIARVRT
jgi:hypothetical protein